MTNLAVRTKAAIGAAPTDHDWIQSQKRLAAAIDLAADLIRREPRLDVVMGNNPPQKDQCYVTLLEVFDKAIEGQVKV